MKVVLQRVSQSSVTVDGQEFGSSGRGYLLLLGITHSDTERDVKVLTHKVLQLRLFDGDGKFFDRSIIDIEGEILVVSQFTLYARTDNGRRPDFNEAAKSDHAEQLYELFVELIAAQSGLRVATGQFGAGMQVSSVNDGPCTLILNSQESSD